MKMGTSNAAEVLSWSSGMNTKYGSLGKIEAGAYADLILIDGNPLDDIEILNQYEEIPIHHERRESLQRHL